MFRDNENYIKMVQRAEDYEEASRKFKEAKSEKRAELECDEYFKWVDENRPEEPFTRGQNAALRVLYWTEGDAVDVSDHVWDEDVKDFIDTLRACGVDEFTVTCKSTGLMENMHGFAANGCTLVGLCEVEKKRSWGEPEFVPGVKFAL